MKRYCTCGRPIWVVFRRMDGGMRTVLYDGGRDTVWMPITDCPCCGTRLEAAALQALPQVTATLPGSASA